MQIKFLSLATLAVLFAAVSAAPPGQAGAGQDVGGSASGSGSMVGGEGAGGNPGANAQQGSVPGSGDEAAFNARVEAIQNDPEIKSTLDFLIQQISGKLNEGSSPSAQGFSPSA